MKKLRVTVEGKTYEVLVETVGESTPATTAPVPTPAPVASLHAAALAPAAPTASNASRSSSTNPGAVPSPLAGKVVSIDVKVGDAIQEGSQVAIVEAMKMNTYISAPKGGTVAEILVNAGDNVEEGSPLICLS